MSKFTTLFFTTLFTLTSGAALAAGGKNNGLANQSAEAGAASGGSEQTNAPKDVDNDKIKDGNNRLDSQEKQNARQYQHRDSGNGGSSQNSSSDDSNDDPTD